MEGVIGTIMLFAGNFAPRGWAICNGQLLAIAQNQALFSIIGTLYGGDGQTTFALPDLRGRTPICPGNGPGLTSYKEGQRGGAETITLTEAQLPAHTHETTVEINTGPDKELTSISSGNILAHEARGGTVAPEIYTASAPNATMGEAAAKVTVGSVGSNQPLDNRPPFLAINYIICFSGNFPSRN